MNFYGADTEDLRSRARSFETCGRTMLEMTNTLNPTVMSASWTGRDAEDLRRRWSELELRIRDVAARTTALGGKLTEHAEEQDSTSAVDGGGDGLSFRDLFGLPDVPSLIDNAASRSSDWIGIARDLAGAVSPGGPAGSDPLHAALAPGTGGRSEPPSSLKDLLEDILGQGAEPTIDTYHGDYDNPADEFDVKPGEGGRETSRTLDVGGKSVEYTTDADGTHSTKVTFSKPLLDATVGGGPASVDLEAEISTSGERKDNGDGTVTYTMSSELTAEARAELKGKAGPVSLSADSSEGVGASTEYSVTVPEDTPMDQVLGITPFDPSSIPPGATVTFASSESRSSGDGAGAGVLGIDLVTVSGEHTSEVGHSTSVGRNPDDTLTVTTGPTDKMVGTGKVQLGPDGLNVFIGRRGTDTDATFETATFADDASGRTAYQEALVGGRFPDDAGQGVVSTYAEYQESHVIDDVEGWQLGGAGSESSSNSTRHDVITRTYADGHEETAEQWLPMGDQSTNSVVESGASDRPSTYAIQLDTSGEAGAHAGTSAYEKEYGVAPGERAGILLTEDEARTVRDNLAGDGAVPSDRGTGETLSILMNDDRGSEWALHDLKSGYHENPDGNGSDLSKPAPGTPYDPETQSVRGGKIVDQP
ncbi:MAG: hypothetical protein ACTHV2_15175 [Brachybacterium sp.]